MAVPALTRVAGPSPAPQLVTANEWKIPFPIVRSGQAAPVFNVNRPVLGAPPGAVRVGAAAPLRIMPVNVGGVPPMPVAILRPGVTRVVQFPQSGSSFNTNYEGNIDSIDDFKISSMFFLYFICFVLLYFVLFFYFVFYFWLR